MDLLHFFRWETKETIAKAEKEYNDHLLPMGEDQKKWEVEMLGQLFHDEKDIQSLHYAHMILREGLMKLGDDYLDFWTKDVLNKTYVKKGYTAMFWAAARLENAAKTPEELPALEQILEYSTKFDYFSRKEK